ncbi:MAG: methyl-accepting chemotaxis protein, partial [Desulfobacula sp.]|nr:methyl-accepting chemotaxis protein [Desulfobacula sp.]
MIIKIKRFKDWGLFSKIAMISIVTILLLVGSISLFIVPLIEKNVIDERKARLQHVIDLSYSMMKKYDQQVTNGIISKKDAMKKARQDIKVLRYGANQSEYIFVITSEDCKMVMHPIKPALDGKELSQTKDKMGKLLFSEMVEVCKKNSHGFVNYYWPKPGFENPVPKLSYLKLFEPWGWIAGTGVYIDDLEANIRAIKTKIYTIIFITILISLALTFYIARRISKPVKQSAEFAKKIATGDLTSVLDIDQKDEVGGVAISLNHMVKNLGVMFGELSQNAETLSSSSTELAAISDQLNSAAFQTSDKVGNIASAVEEMNASVTAISASAEQSLAGVNVMSTAAQEMTGTLGEISQNTEKANKTT